MKSLGQEEALRRVIQEPGWQVAAAILGLCRMNLWKAGNCLDPDEEAARQQLEVWLQAWKANPERPREMLDLLHTQTYEGPTQEPTLWPDAGDTRVGGRSAKTQRTGSLSPCVVRRGARPLLCKCRFARGKCVASAGPDWPGGSAQQACRFYAEILWCRMEAMGDFHVRHRGSPFLQGETRTEKQADEEWLIRFVVFLQPMHGSYRPRNQAASLWDSLCAHRRWIPRPTLQGGFAFGLLWQACIAGMAPLCVRSR